MFYDYCKNEKTDGQSSKSNYCNMQIWIINVGGKVFSDSESLVSSPVVTIITKRTFITAPTPIIIITNSVSYSINFCNTQKMILSLRINIVNRKECHFKISYLRRPTTVETLTKVNDVPRKDTVHSDNISAENIDH